LLILARNALLEVLIFEPEMHDTVKEESGDPIKTSPPIRRTDQSMA